MREIKFRAWKNNKRIADIRVMYIDEKGLVAVNPDIADCVEQFTGLRDKNDREIYEGDIYTCEEEEAPEVVVFYENFEGDGHPLQGFVFSCFGRDKNRVDVEVIGNIHENPELLV